jgi:ATP adenylyltransferase
VSGQPDITPHPRPLWAPWRIEYIRGPKAGRCFLCDKAASEVAADHVIFRGSCCYVLLNDFPYNSGHLLVAPFRHVPDLGDLTADERNEVMALMVKATEVLRQVMAPKGFNLGFNLGEPAGAGLAEHVHGHVVPRWPGDTNFMSVLADARVVPESLDSTAEKIRTAWV